MVHQFPKELKSEVKELGKLFNQISLQSFKLLVEYEKKIIEQQYHLTRLADASTELFALLCTLSRYANTVKKDLRTKDLEFLLTKLACTSVFSFGFFGKSVS